MATDRGIVSPRDRIIDIRDRKPADPINECYFLAELIYICVKCITFNISHFT